MIATDSPRARALRALTREIGEGAIPAFLRARQPAFGDQTGSEILQREPDELLRRLTLLEEARELETLTGGRDEHDE